MVSFLFLSLCLFAVGAILGSFLNVIMYRSMVGESWTHGRSRCDHCRKQIAWFDNIPLLSFLVLSGRCRSCRAPISISHPVVEFLTGTLFVWWYWGSSIFFHLTQHPFHYIQPLFWLAVGVLLLIIFVTDWLYGIIPDEAVWILTLLTFVYRVALTLFGVMQVRDFLYTFVAALVCCGFFLGLWLGTRRKGIGFGDVKFALPFGLLLGWPNVLVGLCVAFVSGAVVSGVLVLLGKRGVKQTVPFGPFLVLGTVVALVWGGRMLAWYVGLLR